MKFIYNYCCYWHIIRLAMQMKALSCTSWLDLMEDIFSAMLIELKAIKVRWEGRW